MLAVLVATLLNGPVRATRQPGLRCSAAGERRFKLPCHADLDHRPEVVSQPRSLIAGLVGYRGPCWRFPSLGTASDVVLCMLFAVSDHRCAVGRGDMSTTLRAARPLPRWSQLWRCGGRGLDEAGQLTSFARRRIGRIAHARYAGDAAFIANRHWPSSARCTSPLVRRLSLVQSASLGSNRCQAFTGSPH